MLGDGGIKSIQQQSIRDVMERVFKSGALGLEMKRGKVTRMEKKR
jgi:hypothetical protein